METIPQYPSDAWVRKTFMRYLGILTLVAIAVIAFALLHGCAQAQREAPSYVTPAGHGQPSPATFEVVRYFTSVNDAGQIVYQEITFTDGRYRYSCRVPGSGAGPVAPAPSCKLF